METEIVNRVASSGLMTIDLEDFYDRNERVTYDIKRNLFQELILKEKEFRAFLKSHDWRIYSGKNVSIICSADVIIPTWSYMLLVAKITPVANHVVVGDLKILEHSLFRERLAEIDLEQYRGMKVIVKGCGDLPIDTFAYGEITRLLLPLVTSLMYGEPCSTVPVFKSK